jgi:hypothetical protein
MCLFKLFCWILANGHKLTNNGYESWYYLELETHTIIVVDKLELTF